MDPRHLNADTDPSFHFKCRSGSTFHFFSDPDSNSAPHQSDAICNHWSGLQALQGSILSLYSSIIYASIENVCPLLHVASLESSWILILSRCRSGSAFHSIANLDPESGSSFPKWTETRPTCWSSKFKDDLFFIPLRFSLTNVFCFSEQTELDGLCYSLSPEHWINPHKSLLGMPFICLPSVTCFPVL